MLEHGGLPMRSLQFPSFYTPAPKLLAVLELQSILDRIRPTRGRTYTQDIEEESGALRLFPLKAAYTCTEEEVGGGR